MIEIDGSAHSGSGTLLRYAAALATLIQQPVHLTRIRSRRPKPGLRAQHLQVLRACRMLSGGLLEGDRIGSREVVFHPGSSMAGGRHRFDIGTAGSTTMLAYSLAPVALFSRRPCRFTMTGGLFQDFAPSAHYLEHVLMPLLAGMGARLRVATVRPGYFPKGQGELRVDIEPLAGCLEPCVMPDQGTLESLRLISLDSHLEGRRVAERMARECQESLARRGFKADIEIRHDRDAVQPGAALLLWAQTSTGCILGMDRAGMRGRKSEDIARFVADSWVEDFATGATTDRHGADQLILFAALAAGTSEYLVPRVTEHVEANLWLVHRMLGATHHLDGNHLTIKGVGLRGPAT